jgi:hypothetical protein
MACCALCMVQTIVVASAVHVPAACSTTGLLPSAHVLQQICCSSVMAMQQPAEIVIWCNFGCDVVPFKPWYGLESNPAAPNHVPCLYWITRRHPRDNPKHGGYPSRLPNDYP